MVNCSPVKISTLKDNEVFVFGANTSGRHVGGGARMALKWGAQDGLGYGISGKTFAIPTLRHDFTKLSLRDIEEYINGFIGYARIRRDKTYLVIAIGCGFAGFGIDEIAPLFGEALQYEHIKLPLVFFEYLIRREYVNIKN